MSTININIPLVPTFICNNLIASEQTPARSHSSTVQWMTEFRYLSLPQGRELARHTQNNLPRILTPTHLQEEFPFASSPPKPLCLLCTACCFLLGLKECIFLFSTNPQASRPFWMGWSVWLDLESPGSLTLGVSVGVLPESLKVTEDPSWMWVVPLRGCHGSVREKNASGAPAFISPLPHYGCNVTIGPVSLPPWFPGHGDMYLQPVSENLPSWLGI